MNFIWSDRVYAFGTYLGSSGLGIGLAVAATVTWALVLKSRRPLTSWNTYLAIALSGTCLLVMKRSGWVALAFGLTMVICLGCWLRKLSILRSLLILVLAGTLAGGFAYWQRDTLVDRIYSQVGWEIRSRPDLASLPEPGRSTPCFWFRARLPAGQLGDWLIRA